MNEQKTSESPHPSLTNATKVWLKIALYSFGGPTNQIAVMHRLIVEERGWISENRFLHALNYCMLLPGPEAHQLAIYIAWLLHGVSGGLIAGVLFVLPGFLSILSLSILYAAYQSTAFVHILFYGIKPAVIAIVLGALVHISKRALINVFSYCFAFGAFAGIFFLNLPFPFIIVAAAILGFLLRKYRIDDGADNGGENDYEKGLKQVFTSPSQMIAGSFKTILIWLCIWFLPMAALLFILGWDTVYADEAILFSKTAMISFGGAYAVLAYIAQQAVQHYGWLKPGEMLDGLGLAETTPGPLIQVVQFVGFLAAFRTPGGLDPFLAGVIGSVISTWTTFVPSFLWIFAGAPYIERLRKIELLNAALSAITASVVGVILNLSLWFSMNTLFRSVATYEYSVFRISLPVWNSIDLGSLVIMVIAMILTFTFRLGIFAILFAGLTLGIVIKNVF